MLILKHISEKVWCECFQIRANLIPKDKGLELYTRASEAGSLSFTRVYTNPSYLESYTLVITPWILPTYANYRVKSPAPDPTHAVVNTKSARLVWITFVRPFIYQCVHGIIISRDYR
jgi:hypothetical protein